MPKTISNIAVVGGIPAPIGGVTTFIRRVVRKEKNVGFLFDLYPSEHKSVPSEFSGKYIYSDKKIITLLKLFFFCLAKKDIIIHFNFSTPRALLLMLLLPKRGACWALTLHHGDLGNYIKPWIKWVLMHRVDIALALNDRHCKWYSRYVVKDKIILSSSYVQPSLPQPKLEYVRLLDMMFAGYKNILVCSGYPREIYNHALAINLMRDRPNDVLFCCLYGEGAIRKDLVTMAEELKNVIILDSLSEDEFNYLLSRADLYLRLNSEDSFGIAIADAINFGVNVLATDVCPRYPGAQLMPASIDAASLLALVDDSLMVKGDLAYSKERFNEFTYVEVLSRCI